MYRHYLTIVILTLLTFVLQAKTIYLDTGGSSLWNQADAVFFVHSWGATDDDKRMLPVASDVYKADIPDGNDNLMFVRMPSGSDAINWNSMWNKTYDLQLDGTNDLYIIEGWVDKTKFSTGSWSRYGGSEQSDDNQGGQNITPTEYDKAVPDECEDIMLQGFYWGSYQNAGFGDTRWSTLQGQISEISRSFTLLWLPPSSASKGDMGYIPSCYSSQSSTSWGKTSALQSLISTCHSNGMRVIADIVINHCGNADDACNFNQVSFGQYGTFNPNSSWITANDEGKGDYNCSVGSNNDDGQNGNDANYPHARDWDHQSKKVQNMCCAYLQWLKNDIQYDGFRFDYAGGYHVSHTADYLYASKPYFSVIEYWNGNAAVLKQRIADSDYSTLAFDFASHYSAFKNGIGGGDYEQLLRAGMRGQRMSKYAVTFVDNHDTFNRSDIGQVDITGSDDGSSIDIATIILQANAYLLAMPGVPCVFYPHWVRYKSDIQNMITARRYAGIHSESQVTENAGTGYYEATVQGHRGQVILYLGSSAAKAAPQGFNTAVKGSNYAMYYTGSETPVDEITATPELDHNQPIYNIIGQPVPATYRGLKIQNGHKHL